MENLKELVCSRSSSIVKLTEVLNTFKEKFGSNFVVGGSLALYHHGFDCQPHDIDLELQTSDYNIINAIVALDWAYRNSKPDDASRYPDKESHYRFELKGVMFDVWIVDKIDYKSWLWSDHIRYADIISIFKKKIAMKRSKDYEGINKYISQLINLTIPLNNDNME